ncbi:hypothetical protein [Acidocella sp.]|uniref:hypothetical protein n=1 Tax=Acidocella sp. TaxID=50710 RepID=UPI003D04D3B5
MNDLAGDTAYEPGDDNDSEALGRDIIKLIADFNRSAQLAGLKGDPLYPLLEITLASLKLQWRLHDQAVRYFRDASGRLDRQYHETIQRTGLVLKRGEQALESRQVAIVEQIAPKIAANVNDAIRRHAKTMQWRTLGGWGIAVLALALLPSAFAYTTGLSTGRAEGEIAGQTIQAAMKGGPDAAATWATLMANNDPRPEMTACRKAISTGEDGRHFCTMPVWLDRPTAAPQP